MAVVITVGAADVVRAQAVDVPDQPDMPPAPLSIAASPQPEPERVRGAEGRRPGRSGAKRLTEYDIPGLSAPVDLQSLDPWDVVQLIEFLAYRGGLNNIVIGKGVSGLTTKLKFQDVTVGEALEIVLSVNNLAYEIRNGIITIMTDEEYEAVHGISFYDNRDVEVIDLQYADPAHVASMLSPLKSPAGTVVSDSVTGTLILIDSPAKIREMAAIVEKADIRTVTRVIPTETQVFVLEYADVEELQSEVTGMLSASAGSLNVNARTKSLIVTDLAHNMRKIEGLIEAFDQPRRQVFIEAKIVEVSLRDQYQLGINWEHLFEGLDPRMSFNSTVSRSAATAGSGIGSLTYKTVFAGGDLTVVLDALKTVGDTKILSNPHVAVMSDEEATIKVVRDQPYAEAQLESGTTNVVGEQIEFIEVGVKLDVTPRINRGGFISMGIKPEVSTVVDEYQAFRAIPVVQKAYAETTVMVRDSETIIIAGMIRNEKSQGTARVPFLGSIPLLGRLFRSDTESLLTSETIVFLTPRIVTGARPYKLLRDVEKELKPPRRIGAAEQETAMKDAR